MTRHNISYATEYGDNFFSDSPSIATAGQTPTSALPPLNSSSASAERIPSVLDKTVSLLLAQQREDGYWWYSLEANETIGAEFVFLMHYLGLVDSDILSGIKNRIIDVQRDDGTWAIYHGGPACLSTTIECYFALRLAGVDKDSPNMVRARDFILKNGGIEKSRVFTKIHLAMFGIVPWHACPEMPAWFIYMPVWFPFNIYEFSSWARATIVPLLVFITLKKTVKLNNNIDLSELFVSELPNRNYNVTTDKGFFSIENFFIVIDKVLKILDNLHLRFASKRAINKCLKWTWKHVEKTEDIYPALAYCALAFSSAGYDNDSLEVKKPFEALKMFQQVYPTNILPALPDEIRDDTKTTPSSMREAGLDPVVRRTCALNAKGARVHQQCCISPLWDTPWVTMALLEARLPSDHPALVRAATWLMRKQIRKTRGDWAIKNPKARPGGFAFEFENDYFPDVDDTAEILSVIHRVKLSQAEKLECLRLGRDWLISMQNKDGGFGAFDKNQTMEVVNRIPFSDHRACLDPSTPDITGRMIEYFATYEGLGRQNPMIARAVDYIMATQKDFGGWYGRWGINYLYGTWNAIMGLSAVGFADNEPAIRRALDWLCSVQNKDGGFSETPDTYLTGTFATYPTSTASQTAWALMGLVAGGKVKSAEARRAANFLVANRKEDGSWDEDYYTGTGFEGHFYIRYHGYRHYFPLLALARYIRAGGVI